MCLSSLPSFRARVEDSHSPVLRDGLSLEAGHPSVDGTMLTPGPVMPVCISEPNEN